MRCAPRGSWQPQGITTILTRLGENLETATEFEEVTQHYLEVLDQIAAAGLDAHISIKPTQLGLDLDPALCERNLERLIERAERARQFRLDRHGELALRRSRHSGCSGGCARARRVIGIAMQAYLYRTEAGRRVAGPARRRHPHRQGSVPGAAGRGLPEEGGHGRELLQAVHAPAAGDARRPGAVLHIATHDIALAGRLAAHIAARRMCRRPRTSLRCCTASSAGSRRAWRREGRRLRVLISYGEYWFPWYMRRLAERPANMWFVVQDDVRVECRCRQHREQE